MRTAIQLIGIVLGAIAGYFLLSSFLLRGGVPPGGLPAGVLHLGRFPYKQAGLTEKQAAAHLLSRFTYGPTPGQIETVVHLGLEKWFEQQLAGHLPDDSLNQRLIQYDAMALTNEEISRAFPRNGEVIRLAVREGIVDKDSVRTDRKEYREVIRNYMDQKGFKPEQELFRQFICQKVLRAAYSQNQLKEVMTDFWFNHFNVSITKNDCANFIPAYERDVIRPGALGSFGDLLLKTAQSPAMLYYLDNFSSSAPVTEGDSAIHPRLGMAAKAVPLRRNRQGLNENYAREVMELHTLGVDGGYTQQDVTQAARVLTGWGIYPMDDNGKKLVERYSAEQLTHRGFVHDGDFLFNANRHDKGQKIVLGHTFPAEGGYEEGVALLEVLAHHPSTAKFISRKLAVRFVSDNPPQTLIDKMAKTFLEKNVDIRQVLITMVEAPEFWAPAAVREKTKSPFELAIGAVRSLNGRIEQPYQLYNWVSRMGERKYYYQAPTGFPDKGAYWINTGSLLNRMNFGLALASGRIPGVSIDLVALNNGHEPESAQAALITYGRLILPERNLDATIKRLAPLLNDPGLAKKVDEASAKTTAGRDMAMNDRPSAAAGSGTMLAQVVGIIIGSPEYQRR